MPENNNAFIETEVLSNEAISRTSHILRLKRHDDFTAGQAVSICSHKELYERIYSIASAEQHATLDTNYKYYLCGSAEMVVDTRNILIDKGIPYQDIRSEIYF